MSHKLRQHHFVVLSTLVLSCTTLKYSGAPTTPDAKMNGNFKEPELITAGAESNYAPELSPRGDFVFFASERSGNKNIMEKGIYSGFIRQLTDHPAANFSPAVSFDGNRLAFVSRRNDAAGDIHVLDLGTSLKKFVSEEGKVESFNLKETADSDPAWLPDNKRILFTARQPASQEPQIMLGDVKEFKASKVEGAKGSQPNAAHDGKHFVYVTRGALFIYNLETQENKQVTAGGFIQDASPVFSEDDKSIYFARYLYDSNGDGKLNGDDKPSVWRMDIDLAQLGSFKINPFNAYPVTSNRYASFYPKPRQGYIYFTLQNDASLDIFRLPAWGHLPIDRKVLPAEKIPDELNNPVDFTYYLRRREYVLSAQGKTEELRQEFIREIYMLANQQRIIEASALAENAKTVFASDANLLRMANLLVKRGQILNLVYPRKKTAISTQEQKAIEDLRKNAKELSEAFQKADTLNSVADGFATLTQAEDLSSKRDFFAALKAIDALFANANLPYYIAADLKLFKAELIREVSDTETGITQLAKFIEENSEETELTRRASELIIDSVKKNAENPNERLAALKTQYKNLRLFPALAQEKIANFYLESDKKDVGVNELRQLINDYPNAPEIVLPAAERFARLEEEAQRYESAESGLQKLWKALQEHGSERDANTAKKLLIEHWLRRGEAWLRAKEPAMAIRSYEKIIAIDDQNVSANKGLIDAKFLRKKIDEEIAKYRVLLSEHPNNPFYLYFYGYALTYHIDQAKTPSARLSAINDSLEYVLAAKTAEPNQGAFNQTLGWLYFQKEFWGKKQKQDGGIKVFLKERVRITREFFGLREPDLLELSADAYLAAYYLAPPQSVDKANLAQNLGETYFELENYSKSLYYYALRIDQAGSQPFRTVETEAVILTKAARAASQIEEYAVAQSLFRRALKAWESIGKTDEVNRSLDYLALSYMDTKDYKSAAETYTQLIQSNRRIKRRLNEAVSLINQGYCYKELQRYDEALENYRLATDIFDNLKAPKNKEKKDALVDGAKPIDLGSESEEEGFDILSRRIQIAAFEAQLYEERGYLSLARDALIKKVRWQEAKRKEGQDQGKADSYYIEELSVSYNNLAHLCYQAGNLSEAAIYYEQAANLAKENLGGGKVPDRAEWLNGISYVRIQTRRQALGQATEEDRAKTNVLLTELKKKAHEAPRPLSQEGRAFVARLQTVWVQWQAALGQNPTLTPDQEKDAMEAALKGGSERLATDLYAVLNETSTTPLPITKDDKKRISRNLSKRSQLRWQYLASLGDRAQALQLANERAAHETITLDFAESKLVAIETNKDYDSIREKVATEQRYAFVVQQLKLALQNRIKKKFKNVELRDNIVTTLDDGDLNPIREVLETDAAVVVWQPVKSNDLDIFMVSKTQLEDSSITIQDKKLGASLCQNLAGHPFRHIYLIGRIEQDGDPNFAVDCQQQFNAQGKTFSFLPLPQALPQLAAYRTLARGSVLEISSEGPTLKGKVAGRSYRQLASLGPDVKNFHTIHVTNPLVLDDLKGIYIGAGLVHSAKDTSMESFALTPVEGTSTLVFQTIAKPKDARSHELDWAHLEPLALSQLTTHIQTTVIFAPGKNEYNWPTFYQEYSEQTFTDAVKSQDRPFVALGLSPLTHAEEIKVAKAKKDEIYKEGNLEEALHYATLLNDNDKIDELLLQLRLERQKTLDWSSALFFQQKIATRVKTKDPSEYGNEVLTIGLLAIQAKEFDVAHRALDEALNLFTTDEDHAKIAQAHKAKGILAQEEKKFEIAIAEYEAALKEHELDEDFDEAAARLLNIANLYKEQLNDYAKALTYYNKASEAYAKNETVDGVEQVAIDRANTLMTMGLTKEAILILDTLLRKINKEEEPIKYIRTAQILSNAYLRAALYQDAMNLNDAILKMVPAIEDERTKVILELDATNLRAMVNAKLGHFEAAMKDFNDGLEPATRYGLKAKLSLRYNNIGFWQREYGNVDESIRNLNLALAIDTDLKSDSSIAYDLRNLGLSTILKGNLPQAKALLQDALSLSNKLGIAYNSAYSEFGLGDIALREKNYPEAKKHFESALKVAEKAYLQDFVWKAYASLAQTALGLNQLDEAEKNFALAVGVIEALRSGLSSTSSKSGFQSDKGVQEVYGDYTALLMQKKRYSEAWTMSERSRSRAFIDSLGNQSLRINDPVKLKVLEQEKDVRNARELAERRYNALPDNSPEREQAKVELEQKKQAHLSVLAQIKQLDPGLADTLTVDPITLAELEKVVPQDITIVEYMVHKDQLFVWIIAQGKLSGYAQPIDAAKLEQTVGQFRNLLQAYSTTEFIGQELGSILLDPIQAQLASAKRIAIIPHGPLHYLSFAALPFKDGYFIDSFSINYLESATVARFAYKGDVPKFISPENSRVLAIGNPDLGKDLDLPFAEKEVHVIPRYFKQTETVTRKRATETEIDTEIVKDFSIVHVASHGVFDELTPTRSSLVFVPDLKNDGFLTVNEVYGLKVQAPLIVLSACETGLGKLSSGDEIVGLNRALFYAGSSSIISSLWRINDVSSAVVMKRLYRYLAEGKSRDVALRDAQLLVRRYYPHPAYWAAFRLLGRS